MTDQLGVLTTTRPRSPAESPGRAVAVPSAPATRKAVRSATSRWLAVLAAFVVGAAVTAASVLLVADAVDQHRQTARVQGALSSTNRIAAQVSTDLAALRRDLDVLTTQVGSDSTALDQDASQLQGAQAALKAAQTHVFVQGSQAVAMHTCLRGVQEALNALAVGNQSDALWMLTLVSSSCAAAASGA